MTALSSLTIGAPLSPTTVVSSPLDATQRAYYDCIKARIQNKIPKNVVAVHPSHLVANDWKALRAAVEYIVFEEKSVKSFAPALDGQTLYLQIENDDTYNPELPPLLPRNALWFSPANPCHRIFNFSSLQVQQQTESFVQPSQPTLNPAQLEFVANIGTLIANQKETYVLVVNLENKTSPDPVKDLKVAVTHLLKEGKIAAFALDKSPSTIHILIKNGDFLNEVKDVTRSTDWIHLGDLTERFRRDQTAAAVQFPDRYHLSVEDRMIIQDLKGPLEGSMHTSLSSDPTDNFSETEWQYLEEVCQAVRTRTPSHALVIAPPTNFASYESILDFLILKDVIKAWGSGRKNNQQAILTVFDARDAMPFSPVIKTWRTRSVIEQELAFRRNNRVPAITDTSFDPFTTFIVVSALNLRIQHEPVYVPRDDKTTPILHYLHQLRQIDSYEILANDPNCYVIYVKPEDRVQ